MKEEEDARFKVYRLKDDVFAIIATPTTWTTWVFAQKPVVAELADLDSRRQLSVLCYALCAQAAQVDSRRDRKDMA